MKSGLAKLVLQAATRHSGEGETEDLFRATDNLQAAAILTQPAFHSFPEALRDAQEIGFFTMNGNEPVPVSEELSARDFLKSADTMGVYGLYPIVSVSYYHPLSRDHAFLERVADSSLALRRVMIDYKKAQRDGDLPKNFPPSEFTKLKPNGIFTFYSILDKVFGKMEWEGVEVASQWPNCPPIPKSVFSHVLAPNYLEVRAMNYNRPVTFYGSVALPEGRVRVSIHTARANSEPKTL